MALGLAAACVLGSLTGQASAQPAPPAASAPVEISGTVLGLDENDLIIDMGEGQGLHEGSVVEIWRPLKLKHPVTGKVLSDRFQIGTLQILQARKNVSLATPTAELSRKPQRGDIVIIPRPKPAAEPEAPRGEHPAEGKVPEAPSIDPETEAAMALLDEMRGRDLKTRVLRYREFAKRYPNGKYTRTLLEEAAALDELTRPPNEKEPKPSARNFKEPIAAIARVPLRLGVELSGEASGAVVHARLKGDRAYQSYPMTAEGNGYWSATIPAERMTAPKIEYFIEATDVRGKGVSVVGEADYPKSISVRDLPVAEREKPIASIVSITTDYADYNRLRGNDRAFQTEGYFGMRFGDTGMRALRSGFGVYRGTGGSIRELDELGRVGRKVGLTYGYLETEVAFVPSFSLIGRVAVGLIDDGVAGGGQMLMRIGSDLGTNLMLGGELLGGVGLRSIVQLQLALFPRFPILLRTEATNQPAGSSASAPPDVDVSTLSGEVGIRTIAQIGMRVIPPLTISLRGSFQGRTIRHAGPGLGAGVSYEW